jgi:hypothetical protein
MVVCEPGADEVAVQQQAAGQTVQEGEGEAALQLVNGQNTLFEVVRVDFLGHAIEVSSGRLVAKAEGAAD